MIISLLFHYIVLFIAFIKWRKTKSFTIAFKILFKRLLAFAIVFTIVRLPSTIVRIYAIFGDPSIIWIMAHHIGLASVGLGNGIVWFTNTHCNTIHKHLGNKFSVGLIDSTNIYDTTQLTSNDDSSDNDNEYNVYK